MGNVAGKKSDMENSSPVHPSRSPKWTPRDLRHAMRRLDGSPINSAHLNRSVARLNIPGPARHPSASGRDRMGINTRTTPGRERVSLSTRSRNREADLVRMGCKKHESSLRA